MVQNAQKVPESPTREFLSHIAVEVPHIAEAATTSVSYLNENNNELTSLFEGLIRFYEGQGIYDRAEYWCTASCNATETQYGLESLQHSISLGHTGRIYQNQGRYEESESVYNQALEYSQKSFKFIITIYCRDFK